jgi:methionyl-tRNA synthetase
MASGFVTLAGQGFSTSRNRAVWAREYLEEGFDPDALRYYLATGSGFQQDLDFSWERFQEKVNSDLVGTVGNFVYRSLLFAERNYEGTPDADVSEDVRRRIESAVDDFAEGVNDYSVRAVGEAVTDLARFGNEYIQRNEPWKLTDEDPEAAAQVIRDCVQVVKAIAVLFQPVAPGAADRVWSQLGETGSVTDATLGDALAAPPTTFGEPTELFEKVEDERVEELNERLDERAEPADADVDRDEAADPANAGETVDVHEEVEPLADERIGFADFEALDLRVGEIRSAEPIEGADELLRLEVDIGVETRQVVAGLRRLHDAESLPGTRVVLVANMERAELFGVESNGMVLAAGEEADLLTTHGDAPLGTLVR